MKVNESVSIERTNGYVIIKARGSDYILSDCAAEDIRLALQTDLCRERITDAIELCPDAFDFSGSMSRDEFIQAALDNKSDIINLTDAIDEQIEEDVFNLADYYNIYR